LHDRLAVLGAQVILDTLNGIEAGTLKSTLQGDEVASLAPKLTRKDGRIDWGKGAHEIHNQVRGMNPWPSAFTHLGNERVKVHRATITGIGCGDTLSGEVTLRETGRLLVGTKDELIEILEVQRESRPRMSGRDFLNGLRGEARFS